MAQVEAVFSRGRRRGVLSGDAGSGEILMGTRQKRMHRHFPPPYPNLWLDEEYVKLYEIVRQAGDEDEQRLQQTVEDKPQEQRDSSICEEDNAEQ